MNKIVSLLAVALLVAALAIPPAALADVLAGVSGLALLGSMVPVPGIMAAAPGSQPAASQVVACQAVPTVVELRDGAGIVVFKEVGGRMTSRFYRASI